MGHLKWAINGLDLIDIGSVVGAQWVVPDPPEDTAATRFWAITDEDPTKLGDQDQPLNFDSRWFALGNG